MNENEKKTDEEANPGRYSLGQVSIVRKFKEALFLVYEREYAPRTAQEALDIEMSRGAVVPAFIGESGLPASLVSDLKDDIPQVLRWLQKLEDRMMADMKMPMVSSVRIFLDDNPPDTKGTFRCSCVLSLDVDGNEIADHLEFVGGPAFATRDELVHFVAEQLDLDPAHVKIAG